MKYKLWLILIFCSIIIIAAKCEPDKDNNNKSSERIWWNNLNETWQIVFLREIDKIGKKPTDDDLHKIINLEKVSCDHFPLGETNLEPLRMLKRLKSVSAGSCFIDNIDALADLDSLTTVILPDNHISSIEALRKHKRLEELYIQITDVENLDALKNKVNLQVLICLDTKINTIEPLMNLQNLSIVNFPDKINDKEIIKFKKLHPDCEVNY